MEIEAPTAAKMVEPPINDIYLCDYCGADFSSLSAIKVLYALWFVSVTYSWTYSQILKAHEAKCMADKALEAQSNNINTFTELETRDMDEVNI